MRRLKGISNDNGVYKQIGIIEAFFIQLSVLHHELSSHHLSALRRIILWINCHVLGQPIGDRTCLRIVDISVDAVGAWLIRAVSYLCWAQKATSHCDGRDVGGGSSRWSSSRSGGHFWRCDWCFLSFRVRFQSRMNWKVCCILVPHGIKYTQNQGGSARATWFRSPEAGLLSIGRTYIAAQPYQSSRKCGGEIDASYYYRSTMHCFLRSVRRVVPQQT